jgi:hypothetical protein
MLNLEAFTIFYTIYMWRKRASNHRFEAIIANHDNWQGQVKTKQNNDKI